MRERSISISVVQGKMAITKVSMLYSGMVVFADGFFTQSKKQGE